MLRLFAPIFVLVVVVAGCDAGGTYDFGIYVTAVPLTQTGEPLTKIMYGNFFGLMTIRYANHELLKNIRDDEVCEP